jgi:hypothetical protein
MSVLVSSIIVVNSFQINAQQPQASAEPFSISINPSGIIQLATNHIQFFTASGSDDTILTTYDWWVVAPEKEIVNSTNYLLLTYENEAYFKFFDKSIEFCWLTIAAKTATAACNSTVTIQQITSQPTTAPPTGEQWHSNPAKCPKFAKSEYHYNNQSSFSSKGYCATHR